MRTPSSPGAAEIVNQIRDACATSGFFQITGHGIPSIPPESSLRRRSGTLCVARRPKTKAQREAWSRVRDHGYADTGDWQEAGLERGTWKEDRPRTQLTIRKGYFIGRESPPTEQQPRPFQEPNIWPPQLPESAFKSPLLEYHQVMSSLSFQLMRILAKGLKSFDTGVFDDFCRDPIAAIRLLHYPSHPQTDDATLVGAGAHTDFGAITLLLQDGHAGLQVLNQFTKEWIDVPPQEHAYVVNVGDMLEAWTSGTYKSNVHRVINASGIDRYSVPFFLDGNADCVIKPLDGSQGKPFTVEQHMLSRYAATY